MKAIYVGVFLTPASKEALLKVFPPKHPEVTADHMTIVFKPTALEFLNLLKLKKISLLLEVVGESADEKGQAVEVIGFFTKNQVAHITISYNKELGGSGKYSNELLADPSKRVRSDSFLVEGYIDTFPRSETIEEK